MARRRSTFNKPIIYEQLMIPFAPHPATRTNHELAQNLNEDYGNAQMGQCYKNSILAMVYLGYHVAPESQVEYVEGWLVFPGDVHAIEHGWLEVDNEVVDVTLPGENEASCYYGVYRYPFEEVNKRTNRRRNKLPFWYNTKAGVEAMKEAFTQLPINQDAAVALACLGFMKTGISSVIIPEGVFARMNHER